MLRQVSERLAGRGHHVTIVAANGSNQSELTSPAGGGLPREEVISGVTVRRVSPEHASTRALRTVMNLPGGWRLSRAVLRDGLSMCTRLPSPMSVINPVLASRHDVVLSLNWIWPPAYGVHLARRVRRFALIGVPILHVARRWAEQPLFHRMLGACDHVLVLTPAEERFVRERCDRPISMVGAGVDPARFAERNGTAVRRAHAVDAAPVVGFVGRQDQLKGATTLIAAMGEVWRVRPEVHLLLAGQSAHRSDEVRAALAALPPPQASRVIDLPDFAETDKPSIIDACDVLALPSVEESFGLVFLEAWICRKPVVGVRIPSSEWVIDEGRDGLLARPMDPADLARCLLELLRDHERSRAMGEAGYRKTIQRYTWDLVTDRWEAVLRETVERTRGAR